MRLLQRLARRLPLFLGRRSFERDLDDEMRFHLEMQASQYRDRGMSTGEAVALARRNFGPAAEHKERVRDAHGLTTLDDAWRDVRFAVRSLARTPGFTLLALFTFALGIGANAAIFSVLNAVLLRPLPYPASERIMTLWTDNANQGWPKDVSSYPNFADWRAQNTTFTEMAAYAPTSRTLTGTGEPEQVRGAVVAPSFFQVMGVSPARGRAIAMDDFNADRRVVVLSDEFWRRRFGGDQKIVGTSILFGGVAHEVVGIMPPGFAFPQRTTEFWVTFQSAIANPNGRGNFSFSVVGRLKPEATIEQAGAELSAIAKRLETEYPATNVKLGVTIVPLHEEIVGDVRPAVLVLMGAVGFVLLIACANIANLLLARGAARTREIAVRSALGAGRGRIVRQLLTESVCLALLGGALGLLLARWGVDLLVALGPTALPRMSEVSIDADVLLFTVGASLLTALLFGLPPALRASSVQLSDTLKEGTRSMAGTRAGSRVRRALVVVEIALALMLLIGAGLLFESFRQLSRVESGFDGTNVVTARISLPGGKYPAPAQARAFYDDLQARVRALPGVRAVGLTTALPLSGAVEGSTMAVEGRPPMPDLDDKEVRRSIVSPGYFAALGIPVLAGRTFTEQERGDTTTVIMINETLKSLHFLGEDPIGRRMQWGCVGPQCPWMTVIGVVRDTKQDGLDEFVRPETYISYLQVPRLGLNVAIRTQGDPLAVVPSLRALVQSMDRDVPVASVATMEQMAETSVATRRFNTLLLGIFSSLALVLALVGIYGVMSYAVSQRSQEVGIRMALGARAGDVLRLILREAMTLAGAGIVLGIILALTLTRVMQSLLFEVSATDVTTFTVTTLVLAMVALIASYLPARRAAGVDPVVALRND